MKTCSVKVPITGLEAGVAGVCAASNEDRPRWFIATRDGIVRGIDLDDGSLFFEQRVSFSVESLMLTASPDGRFLAVGQHTGTEGALFDVATQRQLETLHRGDYCVEHCGWFMAFVDDLFIFATDWNELEVRRTPTFERVELRGEEHLEFFWDTATVSPDGRFIASPGWIWHPIGFVQIIDVAKWKADFTNVPPLFEHEHFTDEWGQDLYWFDDHRLLVSDQILDLNTGEWSECTERVPTGTWHPGARHELIVEGTTLTRKWSTGTHHLPIELPPRPTPDALIVLADALEEVSAPRELIDHCRASQPHGEHCWVIDSLLLV